jgi:hypothetical protein
MTIILLGNKQPSKQAKMKQIIKFVERITGSNKNNLLGRWEITYCKDALNKRIDLANEDHCGVCYSTKYHNDGYIKYMNNTNHNTSDNIINVNRYNRYIEIMNAIKNNRDARNNITDATKIVNKNSIIDLE